MNYASEEELLRAKVRAVNRANALANELGPQFAAALRPFVGQKVFNKGFALSERVKGALPDAPYNPNVQVSRFSSNYSLCWTVRVYEHANDDERVHYEVTFHVGECAGHELKALCPEERYTQFRTDYTVDDVRKRREAFKAADQARDDARAALWPFGERDR